MDRSVAGGRSCVRFNIHYIAKIVNSLLEPETMTRDGSAFNNVEQRVKMLF